MRKDQPPGRPGAGEIIVGVIVVVIFLIAILWK
jgi:hypothetical protein